MNQKIAISLALIICVCVFFVKNFSLKGMEFKSQAILKVNNDFNDLDSIGVYSQRFSEWLKLSVDPQVVPAASAGIIKNGRIVFRTGANADSDTAFGIASLTKTFTALLILQLYEEDFIDIDLPLSYYLPEVVIEKKKNRSVPVSLRHLLAHTSGMPTFGKIKHYSLANGKSIDLREQVYPAGVCYCYSNPGYVLLKLVIEKETGRQYKDLIKEKIFDPLEMSSSTAEWSNGTGGIRSTLTDLSKYTQMLMSRGIYKRRRIITEKSFKMMMQPGIERPQSEEDYFYSLSWEVETRLGMINSFYKAGRWYGEGSAIQVFPSEGIAFIYLCNPPFHRSKEFMIWRSRLSGRLRFMAEKLSGKDNMLLSWPLKEYEKNEIYCGRYTDLLTGKTIIITKKNGHLFSRRNGNEKILRPFSSVRYLEGNTNILYSFVWVSSKIKGLSVRGGYYLLNETVN